MKKNKYLLIIGFVLNSVYAQVQQNVGIGTLIPDPNALLELKSATKGFLPPRISELNRDGMVAPAPGLMIYNLNRKRMEYYNNTCWIPTYALNCDECVFKFKFIDPIDPTNVRPDTGYINRLASGETEAYLSTEQLFGNVNQSINLTILNTLPPGIDIEFDPSNQINTPNGIVRIVFKATSYAPNGSHTVVFAASCGGSINTVAFTLNLSPCYEVNLFSNETNFDLSTKFAATSAFPNYPSGTLPNPGFGAPLCINVNIKNEVTLTSNDVNIPSFQIGSSILPGSLIGISNKGSIIGKGGDGGNNTPTKGGDAIVLKSAVKVEIFNEGAIFGGGGGGAGGFVLSGSPVNAGAGAGGGAGGGLGSFRQPEGWTISGEDGTDGIGGYGGAGASNNQEFSPGIDIPLLGGYIRPKGKVVSQGGNGGDYGLAGTDGKVEYYIGSTINVIIAGQSIETDVPYTLVYTSVTPGGEAGYAIKINNAVYLRYNNESPPVIYLDPSPAQSNDLKGRVNQ